MPSALVQTLVLMLHEGSFHLDDVRHLQDDDALTYFRLMVMSKVKIFVVVGMAVIRLKGIILP